MAPPPLTRAEIFAFHNIDRVVFARLVKDFLRHPGESLLAMALWLWLEQKDYPNIILKLVTLPDFLVFSIADEAGMCLNCLEKTPSDGIVPGGGVLPVTSSIAEKKLSLRFFLENKFSAICGIRSMLTSVCSRAFTDILEEVLGNPTQVALNQPLAIPGFPSSVFGNLTIVPYPPTLALRARDPWAWDPENDVDECDRTVFLTFSRGFPMTEEEVREFFVERFGPECVSRLFMQEAAPGEQSLYSKLVVDSIATVDLILNGQKTVKFQVNGKHIWARKYERRD